MQLIRQVVLVFATFALASASAASVTEPLDSAKIVINEVCWSNGMTPDNTGDTSSDWVELYNRSSAAVDLKGYMLGKEKTISDCGSALCTLPSYSIPAHGFVLVFFNKNLAAQTAFAADASGRVSIRSNKFNLGKSKDGVTQDDLRLFDPSGARISNVYKDLAILEKNSTWGFASDGAGTVPVKFATGTPWVSNDSVAVLPTVVINEVCYKNTTVPDAESCFDSDWVELYNYGSSPVDIGAMSIGKKKDRASCLIAGELFMLPSRTLEPGGRVLVFFNSDSSSQAVWVTDESGRASIRTSAFNLGTTTDDVTGRPMQDDVRLFAEDATRLSNIKGDALVGVLPSDCSYGYLGDYKDAGSELRVFQKSTPWLANEGGLYLPQPQFSVPGGRYATARSVTLSNAAGAKMRYTLDGSDPRVSATAVTVPAGGSVMVSARADATASDGEGRTNAWIRTSPVEVGYKVDNADWRQPKGTVSRITPLRAVTVSETGDVSAETVATYLIGEDAAHANLPVIALTIDPDDFFSDAQGIYVPGDIYRVNGYGSNRWGKPNANYYDGDREVPAHFELLETGSTTMDLSLMLGLANHGGGTRALPQKTLYCVLRGGEYGLRELDYPLLPRPTARPYRRFLLRNNGNDFYGPYTQGVSTLMKDAVLQRIVLDMDIGGMAYRPALVFVNGDYWGIHNIREAVDKHYCMTRYGVDADNVDLLTQEEASASQWTVTVESISGDPTAPDLYLQAISQPFASLTNAIDVGNYTDYVIAETFFANTDWPANNIDFWRVHTNETACGKYGDGRWRWILYDLDLAGLRVDGEGGVARNMFNYLSISDAFLTPTKAPYLINRLWQDAGYRTWFVKRYLVRMNTVLRPERIAAIVDAAAAEIESEAETHFRRWGRDWTRTEWKDAARFALVEYAAARWTNTFHHLDVRFDAGRPGDLELQAVDGIGGGFKVEGETVSAGGASWKGRFLENVPVSVEAVADDGWVFDGWQGTSEASATRDVDVTRTGPTVLRARFRRAGTAPHAVSDFERWQMRNYDERAINATTAADPDAACVKLSDRVLSNREMYAFGMDRNDGLDEDDRLLRMSVDIRTDPVLHFFYSRARACSPLSWTLVGSPSLTGGWQVVAADHEPVGVSAAVWQRYKATPTSDVGDRCFFRMEAK